MAVSQAYTAILWGTGIVLVILPHLNLGLLADYKICGDSECESLLSRVQAIRDHHGKDCRFLSFRQGDTIFVYHKLTGKRENLWAGSIDKQFGYFPKEAVQEEQVYATTEKIVATQKSDFFCMDEFGYPIDSSHLDTDDDDEKIPHQETETGPYTEETDAGSHFRPEDVSTLSTAQETGGALDEEEDESKNAGDAAARTHEEAQEAPVAPEEQGGSASAPWLGSSVTGWLGLAKEEDPGNVAEGERKETHAKSAFTSSVTGWLGLGGEGKPDDAEKGSEGDGATSDSLASTMTGWLGFGGEKAEKEQDKDIDNEEEQQSAEKFRSRRMSLDLEGSQLHEDMGTLDWLQNGLSSRLGFGQTNQEQETTTEREAEGAIGEGGEQPVSSSWFDKGIGGILGFSKDKEVDEIMGNGFEDTEEDEPPGIPTGSRNVDTSQSQPTLTEEERTDSTNESQVEETQQDQTAPPEIETVPVKAESNTNDVSPSDSSKDNVLPEDAAFVAEQKDSSREKKSQDVGGVSSALYRFFQTGSEEGDEDNVVDINDKEKNTLDGEKSAEMEGKDDDTHTSTDKKEEDDNSGGSNAERDVVHRETSTTHTSPAHSADSSVTNTDAEKHQDDMRQEGEGHPVEGRSQEFESSHSANTSAEIASENASEENRGRVSTSESTTQIEDDVDQDSQSEGGAHSLRETAQETGRDSENNIQPVQRETTGFEYFLNERGLESVPGYETEDLEESDKEMKQEESKEAEGVTAQGKQQEVEEAKEEEIKEEEMQGEVTGIKEEGKQEGVGELKEEEQKDETEEKKEEERQEEVEELKEDEKNRVLKEEKKDEMEEVKEDERQGEKMELHGGESEVDMEDIKEKNEQEELKEEVELKEIKEEVEQLKEGKMQEVIEELKKEEQEDVEEITEEGNQEERQQQIKELKEEMQEEEEEEEKEVEGVTEREKKEGEEEHMQLSHFEVEMESTEAESHESESSTETEKVQMEKEESGKEEEKQEEMGEVKDQLEEEEAKENVEGERRDKEEEGSPESDISEDESVRDRGGQDFTNKLSSGVEEAGQRSPGADETGVSQASAFEGVERDEGSMQEEEEKEDTRNDGVMEEERDEDGSSNDTISDLHAVGDNQTLKVESTESGQSTFPNPTVLSQAADATDDHLYSVAELPEENMLHQGDKAEPQDSETSGDGISTEDPDKEERGMNVWLDEMNINHPNTAGDEFRAEGVLVSSSEDLISEQSVPHVSPHLTSPPLTDDHSKETAESRGAFSIFKNTFFFSQTPTTDSEEPTESPPSLLSDAGEESDAQSSQISEPQLDSAADSDQVYIQHLHADPPVTVPQQQLPSPPLIQTPSHPSSLSPDTGSPIQTRSPSKDYRNLLNHVSADETTLLMELFGRHKLQFLDYMLGSSESVSDDPDSDESILLDVERLLHYHMETLTSPSTRLTDAPQEDTGRIRTLIALQKLEMLLARLREAFSVGKSDTGNSNHQDEASCVGESCSAHNKDKEMASEEESSKMGDSSAGPDDKHQRDEWVGAENEKDGQRSGGTGREGVAEGEKGGEEGEKDDKERTSPKSHPNIQPGSAQSQEGMMKHILGFAYQMAEDSITHVHAVKELLAWLTVQELALGRKKQ